MSRAAWAALVIGAAVVAVIVVLILMPRHLPEWLVARATVQGKRVNGLKKHQSYDAARLDKLIKPYGKFMNAQAPVKKARQLLAQRAAAVAKADKALGQIEKLLDVDRKKDSPTVRQLIQEIAAVTRNEKRRANKLQGLIQQAAALRHYRADAAAIHKGALVDANRVATDMPPDALVAKLRKLRRSNPSASGFLARRIAGVPQLRQQAIRIFKQYQTAHAAKPIQYVRAGEQAAALHSLVLKMDRQIKSVQASLADLDHDVDKILADMTSGKRVCVAGKCSLYQVKYKIVRDGKVTTTGWLPVAHLYYTSHSKNLGMVVWSKPRGTVDEQANRYAHPPGYNYVGRAGYGHWRHPGDAPAPPGGTAPPSPPPPAPHAGGRRSALADLAGMGAEIDQPPSDSGQPGDVWMFAAGRTPNSVCGPASVRYSDYILYQRAQALHEAYYGPAKTYGTNGSKSKRCYYSSAILAWHRRQARIAAAAAAAAARRRRYRRSRGYYGRHYGRRSGRYRSGYGYRRSYGGYGK